MRGHVSYVEMKAFGEVCSLYAGWYDGTARFMQEPVTPPSALSLVYRHNGNILVQLLAL